MTALAVLLVGAAPAGAAIHFSNPKGFPVGSDPWALGTGDFNRDGKTDLAVGDFDASTLYVMTGNGKGSLGAPAPNPVGSNPETLAVGRLDKGKDLDIAVGTSGAASLLYGQSGSGFTPFQPLGSWGPPTQARGTAIADFNRDGRKDVAIDEDAGELLVFKGRKSGGFAKPQAYELPKGASGRIAVGNVNQDKRPDLVAVGQGKRSVDLFRGHKGKRVFRPVLRLKGPTAASVVALGDVNGDGRMDIASVGGVAAKGGAANLTVSVLLGKAGGFKAPRLTPIADNSFIYGTVLRDLDGDGKADLLTSGTSGNIDVLRGLGNGRFGSTKKIPLSGGDCKDIVVARMNADKRPDLLASCNTKVSVLLGAP